jgi:hypothetical protein
MGVPIRYVSAEYYDELVGQLIQSSRFTDTDAREAADRGVDLDTYQRERFLRGLVEIRVVCEDGVERVIRKLQDRGGVGNDARNTD